MGIFCQIWPFSQTNGVYGLSRELFSNLASQVGANPDGADIVQVGASEAARRSSQPGPDEILRGICRRQQRWRRHTAGRLHPGWRRPSILGHLTHDLDRTSPLFVAKFGQTCNSRIDNKSNNLTTKFTDT